MRVEIKKSGNAVRLTYQESPNVKAVTVTLTVEQAESLINLLTVAKQSTVFTFVADL